jgi:hypothetical protein
VIITTGFRATGGTHVINHFLTSQTRVPARDRRGLSQQHTVRDYENTFKKFTEFLGEDVSNADTPTKP